MTIDRSAPTCRPLTPERWPDLERLFGPKGGAGGCWCLLWRLRKRDWTAGKGDANRDALRAVVAEGPPPGVLAYEGDAPVGWCAIAPRSAYPALSRSRVLSPVDDAEVWSISCFLIARSHRGQGLSAALLDAACALAATEGASIVEGYPIAPAKRPYPAAYAWTGFASAFRAAGFEEVARRSPTRPIMRRRVQGTES